MGAEKTFFLEKELSKIDKYYNKKTKVKVWKVNNNFKVDSPNLYLIGINYLFPLFRVPLFDGINK